MKTCNKCKEEKENSLFYKNRNGLFGTESICKKCRSAHQKRNIKNNPEKYQKRWRDYRENNLDKVKEKDKRVRKNARANRPDTIKAQKKKSYEKNKSKIIKKNIEYVKERRKTDINFRLSITLRSRLNVAIRGETKSGSSVKDLGCSVEYLKSYLQSLFSPGMTWNNWGNGSGKWQIDHKRPLCSFNLSDREQFLIACNYENLQPLWHEDHIAKSADDKKRSIHGNP